MKIELKKFGEILISRPAGSEALKVILSYLNPADTADPIELDFNGVKVMAPSWLDEVYTGLKDRFGDRVKFLPSQNASVIQSIKTILES